MAESGNGPPRGGHLLPIGRAEQYRAAGANIAMIERELMTADAEQQAERFAEQLFELTNTYLSEADRRLVRKAFDFARREHGDQRRKTGELFINHPVTVATYLASYRLDATAVAAALLHDVAEDIPIPIEQLAVEFGPEIAALVDGVTKLKEVTRGVAQGRRLSSEEIQQATLQKLFAAMTSDVRTVIIKLFDRLHNMRTIDAMSPAKQRAKAKETLSVYAPLAYRLGMWQVKGELEARSLAVLEPHAYETIRAELERLHRHQEPRFATVRAQIEAKLRAAGLPAREIKMSPENIYTVYLDLVKHGMGYRDVDRNLRLTVLMEDPIDCYTALGHLHTMWRAVPHRIDDYISVQRENLYQSLHTTVVDDNGQPLKIRVRTVDMERRAQIGVLARWYYAGTALSVDGMVEGLGTFFANVKDSISVEPHNIELSVQSALEDVLGNQIRVYTPTGEPKDLAEGSTPIDFAYKVHTELGNRCHAVYVNDLLYPLNRALKNGDQVRVVKNMRAQPQRAWLDEDLGFITTTYARMHARRWFRRLPEAQAIREGRQLLQHELEMLGLPDLPHAGIAPFFGYEDATELYYNLGRAELLPTTLSTRIMSDQWSKGRCLPIDTIVTAADGSAYVITNADNRRLRLCGTCDPRPRDAIVGYLRQDGAVTVHREGCRTLNAIRSRAESAHNMLKLGWGDTQQREARLVPLSIDVYDRRGLLHEITQLMYEKDSSIAHICTTRHDAPGELTIEMILEVVGPRQLVRILHQIEALVNVKDVRCAPAAGNDGENIRPSASYWPE